MGAWVFEEQISSRSLHRGCWLGEKKTPFAGLGAARAYPQLVLLCLRAARSLSSWLFCPLHLFRFGSCCFIY